ncbi:hypothetical protein [Photobacterium sanguinicancri]|uniref:Secreted protein n=1 Tax=Photobacterium sanguinicancri TaxID=875932 RepID=A0ABX4FWJ5_9GAMM|nr:hypothetical protein [Photobacterium sanguinicancri]OZS43126.1 hypothetical protein ASV53_14790 [Photobacterium sanguinicancri]
MPRRYPTWLSSFCLPNFAVAMRWSIPDKSVCSKNRSSFVAASYFYRLNDLRECSLITAPTSVLCINHGSAVAVATLCTHQFLNFSAIVAPSSRNAAFNIVAGSLVGKWLHFGGCRKQ